MPLKTMGLQSNDRKNMGSKLQTNTTHVHAQKQSSLNISPLCICQNDNLEMIQLVSTEHEKMDDENPRNNLLTRIKSMRHGSNGSVRASGRTGTTNSSIVSGQAHRCRPCLFIHIFIQCLSKEILTRWRHNWIFRCLLKAYLEMLILLGRQYSHHLELLE